MGSPTTHLIQHGGQLPSFRRESTQTHLTHQHTKAVHVYLGRLSAPVLCAHLRSSIHSCPLCRGAGKVAQVGRPKVRQLALPLALLTSGLQEDVRTADVSVDDGGAVGVEVGEGRAGP